MIETASVLGAAAAFEQSYWWTMSSVPWAGMAAGKGIQSPGVLNLGLGRYGVGKMISSGLGMLGMGEASNTRRFFGGGAMFESSLGTGGVNPLTDSYVERTAMFRANVEGKKGYAGIATQREQLITKARHLKYAGRLIGGFAIANLFGALIAPLVYTAGRGLQYIGDISRQPMQAFNAADWGNQLGSAYMTKQARTERQRAQQILQQTGIVGHGSMGREANRMHG